jgi:putative endonuclease
VLFGNKRKKLLSDKRLLGKWGQKQCENSLKKKGYETLTKNFSCKTGEIDLVMTEPNGTIVFIEVKTRINEDFADAEGAITSAKKQRMARAANFFVKKHKLENLPLRFDAVMVIAAEKGKTQIRHYENAF